MASFGNTQGVEYGLVLVLGLKVSLLCPCEIFVLFDRGRPYVLL